MRAERQVRKSVNDIGGENWGPIPLGQKETPGWAKRLQRNQQLSHGVSMAAHVLRSSDHGSSGASPSLRNESET